MSGKYDSIITLPHHVSETRHHMSMIDRAAQFAPFAALSGYDAAVKETARLTDEKIELDEESLTTLNERLQILLQHIKDHPVITITYFQADNKKSGGEYITTTGELKHIDEFERTILIYNENVIPIADILTIEGILFK